jgi:hypothetical protein
MSRVGVGRTGEETRLVQAVLAIACPRCGAEVGRHCVGDQRVPVFCAMRVVEGTKASFSGVQSLVGPSAESKLMFTRPTGSPRRVRNCWGSSLVLSEPWSTRKPGTA